jgi:hypothetical protein
MGPISHCLLSKVMVRLTQSLLHKWLCGEQRELIQATNLILLIVSSIPDPYFHVPDFVKQHVYTS